MVEGFALWIAVWQGLEQATPIDFNRNCGRVSEWVFAMWQGPQQAADPALRGAARCLRPELRGGAAAGLQGREAAHWGPRHPRRRRRLMQTYHIDAESEDLGVTARVWDCWLCAVKLGRASYW